MSEKFEAWGIVELMGRQQSAGRLSEQMIAGGNLLRVDVPIDGENFRTVFYGASSIYAMHVTDEATARKAAGAMDKRPFYAYGLDSGSPRLAQQGAFDKFDEDADREF